MASIRWPYGQAPAAAHIFGRNSCTSRPSRAGPVPVGIIIGLPLLIIFFWR